MNKSPMKQWFEQGLQYGFKSRGYGRFAYGIPASFFYRSK